MMIEGSGWEIIDLGADVSTEKFLKAIDENPGVVVGLSVSYHYDGKYEKDSCFHKKKHIQS